MSKSRKNKNKGKSLEQQAFETLSKQIHQFDNSPQSNISARKLDSSKPSRLTVNLKLKNGKTLKGSCICFDNPKMPKTKLFFSTKSQRANGSTKDFCIPSQVDSRSHGGDIALIHDMNDFLRDIHKQALTDFPEWLEKWGCRADEKNPLLNLDEIREEWKYKKVQFGIYRLAAQAGFFTDSRPFDAERLEIVKVEITPF